MSWIETCYSRLLIDNHITDLKPEYMSRFDPQEYVRLVKLSGVESAMVYACDHNGKLLLSDAMRAYTQGTPGT